MGVSLRVTFKQKSAFFINKYWRTWTPGDAFSVLFVLNLNPLFYVVFIMKVFCFFTLKSGLF